MNFEQQVITKSHNKPVVVDFWAPWCGPCRVLSPVIESLAEEQKDRWDLVKVNTEEDYELAERYQIRSIPNVKLFGCHRRLMGTKDLCRTKSGDRHHLGCITHLNSLKP